VVSTPGILISRILKKQVVDFGAAKSADTTVSAAGVYLPEGRHPIIPFFQHSNCGAKRS
jgi:hypothetical protein